MKSVIRPMILAVSAVFVAGCAGLQMDDHSTDQTDSTAVDFAPVNCADSVELPREFADLFEELNDETLLKTALGKPTEGKLCQGKVYRVKPDARVTLYRAWNSTNENSRFGQWWAFSQPLGNVARYRSDYEICYQWSPLDKMTQCTFTADTKVVVGTGQSATCSAYLSYPVSPVLQVFIVDARSVSDACIDFDGHFKWVPAEAGTVQ